MFERFLDSSIKHHLNKNLHAFLQSSNTQTLLVLVQTWTKEISSRERERVCVCAHNTKTNLTVVSNSHGKTEVSGYWGKILHCVALWAMQDGCHR